MHEALDLFQEICQKPEFKQTPIFLFLNKKDLFEERLRKTPLTACFPDFKGNPSNTRENIEYIAELFKARMGKRPKGVPYLWWDIAARYKKDVKYAFLEMTEELVKANNASIRRALQSLQEMENRERLEKKKEGKGKKEEKKTTGVTNNTSKKWLPKLIKKQIEEVLDDEKQKSQQHRKVLLLGPGESGKSTILKQLKFIHNQMQEEDYKSFIPALHLNTLHSMKALLKAAKEMEFKTEPEAQEAGARVLAAVKSIARASITPGSSIPATFLTTALAKDIQHLWKTDAIQKAWQRRNEFWLLENADYYFENVMQFAEDEWVPSEEDVIMGRARTTGILQTKLTYEADDLMSNWTLVDVGGQRSERKKWINCFADVTAILFVVNLAGYNAVLFEDHKVNRMHEALNLFGQIVKNPLFIRTPIYLFLNKRDLFESTLKVKGIDECFPEYQGSRFNSMDNMTYISNQFWNQLNEEQKKPGNGGVFLLKNDEM